MYSNNLKNKREVLQGSILGLITFIIITNDLPQFIKDDNILSTISADDRIRCSHHSGINKHSTTILSKAKLWIAPTLSKQETHAVRFSTESYP